MVLVSSLNLCEFKCFSTSSLYYDHPFRGEYVSISKLNSNLTRNKYRLESLLISIHDLYNTFTVSASLDSGLEFKLNYLEPNSSFFHDWWSMVDGNCHRLNMN